MRPSSAAATGGPAAYPPMLKTAETPRTSSRQAKVVNGSRLKDTGGWGYVHNDRQVIIFVDCIHKMMDGKFWYQARGVY